MSDDGRNVPMNELDAQMQQVDPAYNEIRARLRESFVDENNNDVSEILSIYTRDDRLSYLDKSWERELVMYCYNLAKDIYAFDNKLSSASLIVLTDGITAQETSQGVKGNLRRDLNTIRTENVNTEIEPQRKNGLFNFGKKDDKQGGYV